VHGIRLICLRNQMCVNIPSGYNGDPGVNGDNGECKFLFKDVGVNTPDPRISDMIGVEGVDD